MSKTLANLECGSMSRKGNPYNNALAESSLRCLNMKLFSGMK